MENLINYKLTIATPIFSVIRVRKPLDLDRTNQSPVKRSVSFAEQKNSYSKPKNEKDKNNQDSAKSNNRGKSTIVGLNSQQK